MTTVIQFPERDRTAPLTVQVSQEVGSLLGRHRVSQTTLGAWLGLSQAGVSARLRGETEWRVKEIERVAEGFNVHPAQLMGGYATSPRPDGPDGDSLPILLPRLDSNQQPSEQCCAPPTPHVVLPSARPVSAFVPTT